MRTEVESGGFGRGVAPRRTPPRPGLGPAQPRAGRRPDSAPTLVITRRALGTRRNTSLPMDWPGRVHSFEMRILSHRNSAAKRL